MPKLEISKNAKKDLKKFTKKDRVRISKAIDYLETNPYFGKKMSGEFEDLWRIKVPPFRVVYQYDKADNLVTVVSIDYREGIYKRLGL